VSRPTNSVWEARKAENFKSCENAWKVACKLSCLGKLPMLVTVKLDLLKGV